MARKKRKPPTRVERDTWGEWYVAELTDESKQRLIDNGLEFALPTPDEIIFKNLRYQVIVSPLKNAEGKTAMVHLSIRRLDRKHARDWRDFQRIKNELVGDECEAVELYPAESRLVDQANQFHLWCLAPGVRFPFGFDDGRQVNYDEADADQIGAKQRGVS